MPTNGRVEAYVVDPKTKAKYVEHKVITSENQTECHIESKLDECFELHFAIPEQSEYTEKTFSVRVWIDGKWVDIPLLGQVCGHLYLRARSFGRREGQNLFAPYRFSKTQFSGSIHIRLD